MQPSHSQRCNCFPILSSRSRSPGPWPSKRTIKAKLAGQHEEANGHTADRIQLILWFLGGQTKQINPGELKMVLAAVFARTPPHLKIRDHQLGQSLSQCF